MLPRGLAATDSCPETPAANAETAEQADRLAFPGPQGYEPRLPAERGRSSGVEHNLAKVGVEGSNPFARSRFSQ